MGVPNNNPPGILPGNGSGTPAPGGGTLSNPLAGGFYQAYLAGNLPSNLDTNDNNTNVISVEPNREGRLVSILNETLLRDLKPEDDGSGRNSRPYLYTPLPENSTPIEKLALDAARFSYDFPVRGGALSIVNSAKDFLRIGKFLIDVPRGPLFIAKQISLQLSNPKIETGKTLGIENTRLYNLGLNTIAQVPVNAFGLHFDRHGLLPITRDENKYFKIVSKKSTEENRLIVLQRQKIFFDPNYYSKAKALGISITSNHQIIDYWGGPDSFLGIIGRTTVPRSTYTSFKFADVGTNSLAANGNFSLVNTNPERGTEEPYYPYYAFLNETYASLEDGDRKGKIKKDFRAIINDKVARGKKVLQESDYLSIGKTRETRGKLINQEGIGKLKDDGYKNYITNNDVKDEIKFSFESIETSDPTTSLILLFRAHLTNFSDNVTADWNSTRYTGRGENFWTYNSFNRTINFGFTIAALSPYEMKPIYQKLNYLVANLAPVYDTIFMSGPLMKITIGDYIYRQPGFFTSLNLSIDNDSPWETGLNGEYQLPKVINVDASFTPIHTFLARRFTKAPYITPPGTTNTWLGEEPKDLSPTNPTPNSISEISTPSTPALIEGLTPVAGAGFTDTFLSNAPTAPSSNLVSTAQESGVSFPSNANNPASSLTQYNQNPASEGSNAPFSLLNP